MKTRLEAHNLGPASEEKIFNFLKNLLPASGAGSSRVMPLCSISNQIYRLGANLAIIQRNVQDPDFLAEHAAYYSKWSAKISRFCTRIHFFRKESSSDNAIDSIDEMAAEDGSIYLGFVTLRPINVTPIAATILRAPGPEDGIYITSKDDFTVNLAGQRFLVNGTPFLQQDNAVGACAQASIWMALRTLRRKEGQAAYSPAQITTAATRFLVSGRTLPNRTGLRLEQITEAVRAAGYSPHLIPLRDPKESPSQDTVQSAKTALYPYVESGIPVILALFPPNGEGHAVLLIGHSWSQNPNNLRPLAEVKNANGTSTSIFDASSWVEPFVVHNDNTGPYIQLPEFSNKTYCLAHAVQAIPFLPADVFVDGGEAREACLKLLLNAIQMSQGNNGGLQLPEFVVRTYLQDRSDFRSSVLQSSMSEDAKRYYREKWLPKRVWVLEVNDLTTYGSTPTGNTTRFGEVILDPASEPTDGHFLSIHLTPALLPTQDDPGRRRGVIIDRDAFDGAISAFPIQDSTYSPRIR